MKKLNELPHDFLAEKSVLAACLQDENTAGSVVSCLEGQDFFSPKNRAIFDVIKSLFNESRKPDAVSVTSRLGDDGKLGAFDGGAYILELASVSLPLVNWQSHCEILRRKSTGRRLIEASEKIAAIGSGSIQNPVETIDAAQKLILDIAGGVTSLSSRLATDLTRQVIDEAHSDEPDEERVLTGFPSLDMTTNGFRGGQLVVLAARPGIGKTALAVNIALNVAMTGAPVAMYELEMSGKSLAKRLISMASQVPSKNFDPGQLSDMEFEMANAAQADLIGANLFFCDARDTSVEAIHADARRIIRNSKNGLIIVDYLQLMSSGTAGETRSTAIGEITRGLKNMAMDLNVPVLALSQLNREVEHRDGKRAQLSDLRESGSIEQDADIVMFLDRSTTEFESERDDRPDEGDAILTIAKHREGQTGDIKFLFYPPLMKFYEGKCEAEQTM